MTRSLIVAMLGSTLLFSNSASAQRPGAGVAVDSAMAPLAWLIGEWEGEGTMRSRTGSDVASVREKVEGRLDGRVLVIEGVGRDRVAGSGKVVHHAFGVLSYDPEKRRYLFRAFRDGGVMDAESSFADGVFTWEIAIPNGRSRYRIRQEGAEWVETGEYSLDGSTWRPFFEMRLHRVSASR